MVVKDYPHWELVLERLRNRAMPPAKSKQHSSAQARNIEFAWTQTLREQEGV
jgi:hypothetical protein